MSHTAVSHVLRHSPAKGNARLVEIVLAEAVNEKRLQAGKPALVWLSQPSLAKLCNCSRSVVQEALPKLVELGRILDTGERKGRGMIVWHLPLDDLTGNRAGGEESQEDDLTDFRAGDQTGFRDDLTDFADDLTDFRQRPDRTGRHEPGEPEGKTGKKEPQSVEPGPAPSAPDVLGLSLSPTVVDEEPEVTDAVVVDDSEQRHELGRLLGQLPKTGFFDATMRSVTFVCDQLDPDGKHLPFEVHATRAMLGDRMAA